MAEHEGARPGDTHRSDFEVPGMDCPSEEAMVRMALADVEGVRRLDFALENRRLSVLHAPGLEASVEARLAPLGLGARRVETRPAAPGAEAGAGAEPGEAAAASDERRTLWILLAINGVMFAGEVVVGWLAESTGLLADALDMLADATVYAISLYAVGRAAAHQRRAARWSGVFQLALALGLLFEVGRRLLWGSDPEPGWMMAVSLVALTANVASLALVSRHRHGGLHMKASYIFSANDVLANLGVLAAGALVAWTGSRLPDLVIGTLIGLLVLLGAVRILRLR